jgi:hypothetical protein
LLVAISVKRDGCRDSLGIDEAAPRRTSSIVEVLDVCGRL